jgi:tripartite-type tricarboxylate transporter receptor subunit TctC
MPSRSLRARRGLFAAAALLLAQASGLGLAQTGAAAGAGAAMPSASSTWPGRPVRIIVPFPPGGAIDALGRLLAQHFAEAWGQPVVVENRAGAGGLIGTEAAARAAPDGLTLAMGAVSTHAINPAIYRRMPYEPLRDFAPIAPVAIVPNLLVVHPGLGVNTVAELVALAQSRPGQISYASAGAGTTLHIACELFQSLTKTDLIHVPYKGSGPAVTDVVGGRVPVMCDSITSAQPHVRAGRLRALGVTSATRSATMPEVPTLAEAGVSGYEMNPWFGLFAPAGTPAAVVARIHADVTRTLARPEVRERLMTIGAEPMRGTPEQFAAMIRADLDKWGRLVKSAGITAE